MPSNEQGKTSYWNLVDQKRKREKEGKKEMDTSLQSINASTRHFQLNVSADIRLRCEGKKNKDKEQDMA